MLRIFHIADPNILINISSFSDILGVREFLQPINDGKEINDNREIILEWKNKIVLEFSRGWGRLYQNLHTRKFSFNPGQHMSVEIRQPVRLENKTYADISKLIQLQAILQPNVHISPNIEWRNFNILWTNERFFFN